MTAMQAENAEKRLEVGKKDGTGSFMHRNPHEKVAKHGVAKTHLFDPISSQHVANLSNDGSRPALKERAMIPC
jgi:hypothetical protein